MGHGIGRRVCVCTQAPGQRYGATEHRVTQRPTAQVKHRVKNKRERERERERERDMLSAPVSPEYNEPMCLSLAVLL